MLCVQSTRILKHVLKHVLKRVDWLVDERVNSWVDSWAVAELIAELIAEHVDILIVIVLESRNYEERKKVKTSNSLASAL